MRVNDLIKLRLSIDKIEVYELSFLKTCPKCLQSCNNIDAIIPYWGWNDISCKKGSCEYWIHKSIDSCQTEDDVNCSPSCFTIWNSFPNDDNTRHVNDVILRTASIDDDVIIDFNRDGSEGAFITQTIISE